MESIVITALPVVVCSRGCFGVDTAHIDCETALPQLESR